VYCSAATKELLLRLERYPHRLNFALGILESRKQHYRHLKNLLKPIPLETPTRIELEPGNDIQVTLFDANHCTGAVMFCMIISSIQTFLSLTASIVFEGDGVAVLYTGDIRSEPWFVNSLTRNPLLIEYATDLKTLDCIYLDTSFTENIPFPTKAEGLKELLQKVAKYPLDTTFHFAAWTFGYEEVWMALSRALKSPIHVDSYKMRLYQSLRGYSSGERDLSRPFIAHEGPALTGYKCGNTPQSGCLTHDQSVRIHSCEKGMGCSAINEKTVWIHPIITRASGYEMGEIGIGGGGGDLTQRPELELDNDFAIERLLSLFGKTDASLVVEVKRMLLAGLRSSRKAVSLGDMGLDREEYELSIKELTKVLARSIAEKRSEKLNGRLTDLNEYLQEHNLPKVITFPYSRHSSYAELCHLVGVFKPRDVYPCTVDESRWHEGISIKALFGQQCSATLFRHDLETRELHAEFHPPISQKSQTTASSQDSQNMALTSSPTPEAGTSPTQPVLTAIRRNSSGHLRSFDQCSNEIPCAFLRPIEVSTPLADILAVSPGSESQGLRRKFILDGLGEVGAKRPRFESEATEAVHRDNADHQESSVPRAISISSGGLSTDLALTQDFETSSSVEPLETYWDPRDEVYRCTDCGHEAWRPSGNCTGCGAGEVPYFEVMDSAVDVGIDGPGIVHTEYDTNDDVDSEMRAYLVSDYLDYDSSAYDSVIGAAEEDYEQNSFIDNKPVDSLADSAAASPSNDEEIDYKEQFNNLSAAYDRPLKGHNELIEDHDTLRRDFLGSDYESETFDSEEDGMVMVDVDVREPGLAELVLSQAQSQSQSQSQASSISTDRLTSRIDAYEATMGQDGRGWHEISLLSTGGHHTTEEVEL
jgi:DNA cross-link repair 1C protein